MSCHIMSCQTGVENIRIKLSIMTYLGCLGDLIGYLIKELPVHKKRVVWLSQLACQKSEEPAHLGWSKVWVVHHHLGNQTDIHI